jgi:hypothetical protein
MCCLPELTTGAEKLASNHCLAEGSCGALQVRV